MLTRRRSMIRLELKIPSMLVYLIIQSIIKEIEITITEKKIYTRNMDLLMIMIRKNSKMMMSFFIIGRKKEIIIMPAIKRMLIKLKIIFNGNNMNQMIMKNS